MFFTFLYFLIGGMVCFSSFVVAEVNQAHRLETFSRNSSHARPSNNLGRGRRHSFSGVSRSHYRFSPIDLPDVLKIPKGKDLKYLMRDPTCRFSVNQIDQMDPYGFTRDGKKQVVILSLDGGGVRGFLLAEIIAHLEKELGVPITDVVDVLAGTSTGAIVSSLLAVKDKRGYQKYLAKDGATLAQGLSKIVFKNTAFRKFRTGNLKGQAGLFGSLYSAKPLETLLWGMFENTPVSKTKIPLVLTSYDVNAGQSFPLSTWDARHVPSLDIPLWQAVRSSTAAPVYFKYFNRSVCVGNGLRRFVAHTDGAIDAYSPELIAVNKIRKYYPRLPIVVISISTGYEPENNRMQNGLRKGGVLDVLPTLTNHMFQGQKNLIDSVMDVYKELSPTIRYRIEFPLEKAKLDDTSTRYAKKLSDAAKSVIGDEERWREGYGIIDDKNPTRLLRKALNSLKSIRDVRLRSGLLSPEKVQDFNNPNQRGHKTCQVTGILDHAGRYHTQVNLFSPNLRNPRGQIQRQKGVLRILNNRQCIIQGKTRQGAYTLPLRCSLDAVYNSYPRRGGRQSYGPLPKRYKVTLTIPGNDCAYKTLKINTFPKYRVSRIMPQWLRGRFSNNASFSWEQGKGQFFFFSTYERPQWGLAAIPTIKKVGALF